MPKPTRQRILQQFDSINKLVAGLVGHHQTIRDKTPEGHILRIGMDGLDTLLLSYHLMVTEIRSKV